MERIDNEKKYNKYNNYKKNKKYEAPIVEEEVTTAEDVIVEKIEDVANETIEVEEKVEVIAEKEEKIEVKIEEKAPIVTTPKVRKRSTVKKIFS